MAFFKLWSSYKPTGNPTTYVGNDGDIILDAENDQLRIMDGVTPGGTVFDPASAPGTETYNVQNVTGPTATITTNDYYVAVNYAGAVTIDTTGTFPNGFKFTLKDESGAASANPITFDATVDGDPGGVILAIDNGCLTFIYNNNSWRIV